jgi:L-fuculose-phosphate aldolase
VNRHGDDKNKVTKELRISMVDVSRRLYDKNYVVATSGNISVRTEGGFLITPSARRKDSLRVEAIVACHASGEPVDSNDSPSSEAPYLTEQAFYTGPAHAVPFAVPGSREVCNAIKKTLSQYNSFILERHGALVLGSDLEHAFNRLEQLEYVADVVYHAVAVGEVEPFSADDLERIGRNGLSHYAKQIS